MRNSHLFNIKATEIKNIAYSKTLKNNDHYKMTKSLLIMNDFVDLRFLMNLNIKFFKIYTFILIKQ
jgi:hypothetical protein